MPGTALHHCNFIFGKLTCNSLIVKSAAIEPTVEEAETDDWHLMWKVSVTVRIKALFLVFVFAGCRMR